MKKSAIILLTLLSIISVLIWFSCNPLQKEGYSDQKFNILDEGDLVKATGVTDPFSKTPVGFASLNGGTTGGAGGKTVTVTTLADLVTYATASEPYIIKISGTITAESGDNIFVKSNKTIVGVGSNAAFVRGEFRLDSQKNIIIRNLTIRDSKDGSTNDFDGIQTDYCSNIWIDHCHLTNMNDGLIDIRNITTYVTVSWCILSNHDKAFGLGWNDNTEYKVTIHHNWIHDTNQRNPSFDNGIGHLYNNFLENITSYGNYSRGKARLVIENSYFSNVVNPYYPDSTAQLVAKGNTVVNCSGKQQTLGSAFTPSSYYSYSLDPTANVPDLLRTNAGPNSNIVY